MTCKCRVAEVVKHKCMACSQLPHELPTNIMPKQKLDGAKYWPFLAEFDHSKIPTKELGSLWRGD